MNIDLQSEKIFILNQAVDFRRGIDGLCSLVVEELEQNPGDGIYIFYNKHFNKIKIIGWHNNGFIMIYKRLDKGRFFVRNIGDNLEINSEQLNWLLLGTDWRLLSGKVACESKDYY